MRGTRGGRRDAEERLSDERSPTRAESFPVESEPDETDHVPGETAESAELSPPPAHSGPTWRRVAGIPIAYYAVCLAVLLVAALTGNLPPTLIAGFAATLLLGNLLFWIGTMVPVVRDFGLPAVLCSFIPAILIFFGLLPDNLVEVVRNFVDPQGFLDFFVISIIAGAILGMPKALLIKAGPRFAVPIVGTLIATFAIVGAVGFLFGFGFREAVLFIAAPIMAGGLGLGAIPMADMYAAETGSDPSTFLGNLISAVVIANIVCILMAGFYSGIGRSRKQWFVGFNGFGQLMRVKGHAEDFKTPEPATAARFAALTQGIMITGTLSILGTMIGAYVTALHPYAWTIIIAALIKISGVLPHEFEQATSKWGDVMSTAFVPALLVGVSITYIDIEEVLASLSNPAFIPLTLVTVLVATITSGTLGWLMKFYFVEAAITPGLVMADTGGSGDVSVLSAAGRMHLMPFAALTNRIGGALVLFVTSLLVPLLAGT